MLCIFDFITAMHLNKSQCHNQILKLYKTYIVWHSLSRCARVKESFYHFVSQSTASKIAAVSDASLDLQPMMM